MVHHLRLVGQAVKTPASHAGNGGSIPPRVTTFAKAETYSSIAQSVERVYRNIPDTIAGFEGSARKGI